MTSRYVLRLTVVPSQYSNVVLNCVRMEIVMREVYVIGHKNPDTDSVCSAICYSRLKNLITGSEDYIPKRAGHLNEETQYVLEKCGVKPPAYIKDVRPQVRDIDVRKISGISEELSVRNAWKLMKERGVETLPIIEDDKLKGLVTISDVAKSYFEMYDSDILSVSGTSLSNIVDTLKGEVITGDIDKHFNKGKMIIAAANPDMMENMIEEGDFVILGNRYESQLCAIEMEAGCLIICEGAKVSSTITKIAAQHNCVIISTAYDTYTVARLINQAIPVSFFMKQEALIKFKLNDFIEDIQDIMAKKRYRDFPIEDDTGRYVGMISRRNIIKTDKKKIILVDHNEKNQAVFGIEDTDILEIIDHHRLGCIQVLSSVYSQVCDDILEIIDHHRLGCIQTITPVFFRNQPLGCTATIIYQMYCEHNIDIDKTTAALLCSAIISDTLILKSPTCTHYDVDACQVLADIAGIDIEEYGREMFRAGSNLSDKSEEEIFYRDYKKFSIGEITVGVGQVNCMSQEEIEELIKKEASYITSVTDKSDEINIAYLLLTDVMKETSYVMLSGKNAEQVLMQAFNLDEITNNYVILPGVVSRKKQFLPAIVEVLQQ